MRKAIGAASDADLQKLKKNVTKDTMNIKKVVVGLNEEIKINRRRFWLLLISQSFIVLYLILTL